MLTPHAMRRAPILCLAGTLLSGCFDMNLDFGLGPSWDGFGSGGGCSWFCIDFGLATADYTNTSLIGDTVRVDVIAVPEHDTAGRWSATGVIRLVDDGRLTTAVTRRGTSILAIPITAGEGTVNAVALDTTRKASLYLYAVDSAAVTGIALLGPPNLTLRVGDFWTLASQLEAPGVGAVGWRPGAPEVSDTLVLRAIPGSGRNTIDVRALRAGTATVTIRFRGYVKTANFVVTN